MSLLIDDKLIVEVARIIWKSVLGLDLELATRDLIGQDTDQTLSAQVQISGAWEGVVTLQCPCSVAQQAAASIFHIDIDSVSDADVKDAVGELSNMVSGNIKALLPEPSRLALPIVSQGSEYSIRLPGGHAATQLDLLCDGLPVRITVLQGAQVAVMQD